MSEERDGLDIYHPDVVEAFAAAWASIDGKLEQFEAGKGHDGRQGEDGGSYDGYMYEANELLRRASKRITGFDLWTRLDPSP